MDAHLDEDLDYLVASLRQALEEGPDTYEVGAMRKVLKKEDKRLSQSFSVEKHDLSDIIDRELEVSFDSQDLLSKKPTKFNTYSKQSTVREKSLFLDQNKNMEKAMLEVSEQLSKGYKQLEASLADA